MMKRIRLVLNLLGAAFLLAACAVASSAQTSAEITGLVTDPAGAAVSGASVTITNKATGANRNATTNSEGLYSFPSLPPGTYELKVEQTGFKISLNETSGSKFSSRRDWMCLWKSARSARR